MNDTIKRFGYPTTLVADYRQWVVLVRPAQPTLGSLILAAKSEALSFAQLAPAAFQELTWVVRDIEAVLASKVRFEKINYLMLMMVDPHVHFHVIPRYDGAREMDSLRIFDRGWPKPPLLTEAVDLEAAQLASLKRWLRTDWPSASAKRTSSRKPIN